MAEIYKSLNYEHNEINNLLKKIESNHVLTADEYDRLIRKIGLSKLEKVLENFDGTYDSLKGRPNIHEIAAQIALGYYDALRNELLTLMSKGDEDVREDFKVDIDAFHELLFNLEDGVITLDEKFKEELKKELDEYMVLLSELEESDRILNQNKADRYHLHDVNEITNLDQILINFDLSLRDEYHLEELNDKAHTHPEAVMRITPDDIDTWNNKTISRYEHNVLKDSIAEIRNKYVTKEDILTAVDNLKEDLSDYLLKQNAYDLLDDKAHINHMHDIKKINGLSEALDLKVNKERNKVLIDVKLLARIKNLLAQKELFDSLKEDETTHGHGNINVLNSITDEELDKWNNAIDEETVKDLIKKEMEDNTYDYFNFYTKEEVDLLLKSKSNTGSSNSNLEDRLNGLTFMPITETEYNMLSNEEKENPSIVYIVTDIPSLEQDKNAYVTNDILDLKLRELLDSGTVLSDKVLDNRLDGLTLKKITSDNYNKLTEKEEGVLYVITDAEEINIDTFLTKEDFKKRIGDPATTNNRPQNPIIGQCYFDTTLNKPVWFNGSVWVDALGNPV